MTRRILVIAIICLLAATGVHAQTVRDSANTAWITGRTADAERLYARVLAQDSSDEIALHRLALVNAWGNRFTESMRLFDKLLHVSPGNRDARLDRARVLAWSGNTSGSIAVLDSLLVGDPGNIDVLQARAQFESWVGNYDEALRGYDAILGLSPENRYTRIDRARVLSWAGKFKTATAVYDSLLAKDPGDRDALLGLGNVLTLSSRHDSARVVYARLLKTNPSDIDALRGLARAATWGGDLTEAEGIWRRAIAAAPSRVDVLVGYAQALRWEGRDAAAREVLDRAAALQATDPDVREQRRWVDVAMAPRAGASATYETDSDKNTIYTTSINGAVRITPRVEIRADGYDRHTSNTTEAVGSLDARGLLVGAWLQIEPGWSATLSAGGATSSVASGGTSNVFRATVSTPGRYNSGATLTLSRGNVDGTTALISRRVYADELNIDAHSSVERTSMSVAGGIARFNGRLSGLSSNRWSLLGVATRPLTSALSASLRARAFGFNRDLNDGYFDPDFYGLLELSGRVLREAKHWGMSAEIAPGIQKVRSTGDPSGSFRAGGRVAYTMSPGRTIGVNGTFSKSGLQQLSPTAGADYRYSSIGVTGAWTF